MGLDCEVGIRLNVVGIGTYEAEVRLNEAEMKLNEARMGLRWV